jgi:hypothetical protein
MIGYEPATQRMEFYYAVPQITPAQLAQELDRYGIVAPHAVIQTLADCIGLPPAVALHWIGIGLSIAIQDGQSLPGATLFFRAKEARGGLARARAALLRHRCAESQRDSAYARLFARAEDHAPPDHGVIAIIARTDADIELRAGLSAAALARARATCIQPVM